jgi:indole-3-glycerol phosphate synthase
VPTILDKIVATKWQEIAAAKARLPLKQLEAMLADAPAVRDFHAPLRSATDIRLIAEVKKASPSKGIIRADFDPLAIARTYADNGAACISVLTDENYFQGSLDYLRQIRAAVSVPLLRKDFMLDEYQVLEARVAGADAILLIAECLSPARLKALVELAHTYQMTALVEFYDDENLSAVIDCGTRLCGVNNRDLRTFQTDLHHTIRMRQQIPAEFTLVGESGIHTRDDALLLENAGVNAMLVGESLMKSDDVGLAVRRLLGTELA